MVCWIQSWAVNKRTENKLPGWDIKEITIDDRKKEEYNPNPFSFLAGLLTGGLVGAVTMLLLAPKTGKDTRRQIRKKSSQLYDQTTDIVEDTVAQGRSTLDDLSSDGRDKIKELKQHGQKLAIEQLDHLSKATKAGKKAARNA